MPYAVELFLDEPSAAPLRDLSRRLADAGIGSPHHAAAAHPHVTLGVADDLDWPAARRVVAELAAETRPMPLRFSSLGVFASDPGVLFLAPVVTGDLLHLHERFQARFAPVAERAWPYYAPGAWVPHCTVAIDVPRADLARALAAALDAVALPLAARLDRAAVVEFRPIVERAVFPLGVGRGWRVMRQDDTGNRHVLQANLSQEDAHALAALYEQRGHKQSYWAEPVDPPAGGAPATDPGGAGPTG